MNAIICVCNFICFRGHARVAQSNEIVTLLYKRAHSVHTTGKIPSIAQQATSVPMVLTGNFCKSCCTTTFDLNDLLAIYRELLHNKMTVDLNFYFIIY